MDKKELASMMLKVSSDLHQLADSISKACEAIRDEPAEAKKKEITLEQVRGVLAKKSEAGFTAEVKGIIQKFGAKRLSEIDPKDYKAVMEEAEGLGNG